MLLSPFHFLFSNRENPHPLSLSLYFSILNVELVKRTHIWKEDGKINPLKGDWTGSVTRSIHRGQDPLNPLRSFPSHWRHDDFFQKFYIYCSRMPTQDHTQDSATLTGCCRTIRSGEGNILSLALVGIVHSSTPEDISGIFTRFTRWKKERVWAGRMELTSLGYASIYY